MRCNLMSGVALAMLFAPVAATSALAADPVALVVDHDKRAPEWVGSGRVPKAAYEPRTRVVVHSGEDPYKYSYAPRSGYYPYYGSGYWRPVSEMRHKYRVKYHLPPYYQSWGWNRAVPAVDCRGSGHGDRSCYRLR